MGIFKKIKGLMIGRGFRYNKQEIDQLKEIIIKSTEKYNFPVLYGLDIGHTDPIVTIPIGVKAKMDSRKNYFGILESGIK